MPIMNREMLVTWHHAGCLLVAQLLVCSWATGALWAQEPTEPTLPPVLVTPGEAPPSVPPATELVPSEAEPVEGAAQSVPGPSSPAANDAEVYNPPPSGPMSGDTGEGISSLYDGNYLNLSESAFGSSVVDPNALNSAARLGTSLYDLPNLATIVERETLSERQSSDLARALQSEVGVLLQQTARGQVSPFIRGVTGEQILVLVDGVRLNNTTFRAGPNQYYNTVDPGQVERIEVIRGSQSVLWGSDAIGGVINIVTRGADPNRGEYREGSFVQYFSTADSGSYSRANLEGWMASQGIFAGASYLNVHDLDRGGDFGRQPFTNFDQYAGDIKYNLAVDEDHLLTLSFSHFVQRDVPRSDRFAPFVFGPPANTPRPTFFDPQQRDMAVVRWQGVTPYNNSWFDAYSITASYTLNREGSTEIRSATQEESGKFRNDMGGLQLSFGKDLADYGNLTYGSDYYYEDIDSSRFRVNPSNRAIPPSPRTPQFPDDAVADRLGAFLYWDVPVTDRLRANTGVRYENANLQATPEFTINNVAQNIFFQRTYQDWISSIGLSYDLTTTWKAIGGVYEGYRAPTIDDLTASKTFLQNAQSNPELGSLNVQPEHSLTYEVGFKHDSDALQLQVVQWWMQLDDYISREVDGAGNVILGNSDAYLYGTELAGEYRWNAQWSNYGNFWYTLGRDNELNEPFTRIPPMQGVLGLRWREAPRGTFIDLYTWLVDRQDRYNSVNLTDSRFPAGGTPGYGTLNLRLGTTVGPRDNQRLTLSLENITDKYYRVLGSGVDGPGFNAIFGWESSF